MTNDTKPTVEPPWWGSVPSWTPAAAKSAYTQAQSGTLTAAADLCDALRSDARIRGVLETRKNSLFGCDLDFEVARHRRQSNPIVRALKDEGEFWAMAPESSLAQIFLWGLLLNIGLGELTWRRTETVGEADAGDVVARDKRWTQLLTPKHPRNLRFDFVSRTWKLTVEPIAEIDVEPGDGRWVMFTPFGDNRPWQHGLYWALALLWLSKSFSDFDWGRRNEARGRAALVGTTPDGSTDEDRKAFARQLYELRTKLGIALPPGYGLSAVEFGGTDHETFKARIDWADAAIGTVVLGQNLTADTRASSLAAPKTNDKVRQDYLEWDAETLSTCLREQMLRPYANVRYGNAELAPWPVWGTEPPEDIVQLAETTDKAARALAALLEKRVPVDVVAYCEQFKIPLVDDAAARLAAPTHVPPPARPAEEKED